MEWVFRCFVFSSRLAGKQAVTARLASLPPTTAAAAAAASAEPLVGRERSFRLLVLNKAKEREREQ